MKQTLSVIGALAIIALVLWLLYLCVTKLVDIGAEGAQIASIAEFTPKEEALKLQIYKDAIAMEAAALLINQSVLSGKTTAPTIKVCVETVRSPGALKRGPWLRDDYKACDKGQYTVTFPVTYDAFGKATIGMPIVATQ